MSKLSVNHLFHALQSGHGPHGMAVTQRPASAALSAERLSSLLETPASTTISRFTAADLAHAIRRAFDLDRDQIVADPTHLLDLPTVPTGRRLRFDSGHTFAAATANARRPDADPPPTSDGEDETQSTVAESLSTALGAVEAREVLLRSHWIVLVMDGRSVPTEGSQEALRLLARQRRVLVVWCLRDSKVPRPACQDRQGLEEILGECGFSHFGPLSGVTADELASIFQALKVMAQAPLVYLRVDDHDAAEKTAAPRLPDKQSVPAPALRGESSAGDGTLREQSAAKMTQDAIESTLVEIAVPEPHIVVIDRRGEIGGTTLPTRLGRRYFASAGQAPYLWQWCAGIVAGGCRPIVLIPEEQWAQTQAALAALPEGVELRATAVVFEDQQAPWHASSQRGVILPDATVVAASALREFEDLLSASLRRDGLTIIGLPADARGSESNLKVRFDPAETIWLDQQNRAGLRERREILEMRFSADLARWISAYEQVGQRAGYLWKWCLHGVELTTLSCVRPSLRADVCDTKVLAGMLNVLIDDVGDRQGGGELLAELLKLTHHESPRLSRFSAAERRYGQFTCEVWSAVWGRVKRYPCYDPYAALLQFDLAQLFNTVRYSHLVNNNPYILNVVEHDEYSPQGMGLLSFAMIDLMCSPEFSVVDLGRLREAMWHAQWMARIGNLVTTWQREVNDRDYTSGVFAQAVANRDVTVEQLLSDSPPQIAAAIERGGHEAFFLRRWKQHRAHLQRLLPYVKSVDLQATVRGLERLLQTELVSRGEK